MNVRKKTLWQIPAYVLVAGAVSYFLVVMLLSRFAVTVTEDGTYSVDPARQLIIYALLFVVVLALGGRWFCREMTRWEIFWSSTIVAAYGLILLIIQLAFDLTTGKAGIVMYNLYRPFEWCSVWGLLFGGLDQTGLLGSIVQVLSVYLFMLFGKKR